MSKRRYDGEQARKVIIEQSKLLFSRKGYAGTSIEEISKLSGYSKGHIYYYFQNKENLFVYLAQDTMREWAAKWEAVKPTCKTATDKLYAMARHVVHNYKTPLLQAGQELAANPNTSPETAQALYGLAVTPLNAYAQILQEGAENGEFMEMNIQEQSLLLGAWLGGLCQFIHSMDMKVLETLFEKAITSFLVSIRQNATV